MSTHKFAYYDNNKIVSIVIEGICLICSVLSHYDLINLFSYQNVTNIEELFVKEFNKFNGLHKRMNMGKFYNKRILLNK